MPLKSDSGACLTYIKNDRLKMMGMLLHCLFGFAVKALDNDKGTYRCM